jgi:hypothetical protein
VLLEYDVTGTKDQQPAYGRGSIAWTNEGQRYKVEGKAKALFFTLLNFTSVGELDAWGVSPELYTEQKGFKSATNTHFNRERNVVSFSASTTSYPRRGGEQDRASLIWQLAAIGRGDPGSSSRGGDRPVRGRRARWRNLARAGAGPGKPDAAHRYRTDLARGAPAQARLL